MKTRSNNFKLSTTFWLFAASQALYAGFAAADCRQDAGVNQLARSLATRHFLSPDRCHQGQERVRPALWAS